ISSILGSMVTDKTWEPVTKYSLDTRDPRMSQFLGRQKHIVTEHYGELHPLDIDDYVKRAGFKALKAVLTEKNPDKVIQDILPPGLRGRGGGGGRTQGC